MNHSTRVTRRPWPLTSRIACAIAGCTLIAACGANASGRHSSSSSAGHPTQAQIQDQIHQDVLRFARCMRSQGVPNFPDPTSASADKEFLLGHIPGLDPQAPAFQSADTACKHLLPGAGTRSHEATVQAMAPLLRTSRCMRAHGLQSFPDPTASAPANQAAYLDIVGFSANNAPPGAPPVAYLAIPNSINPNSPAARRAAAACHFRLQ